MEDDNVVIPACILIIAAAYYYIRRNNNRRRRAHWVRPWIQRRVKYGAFHALQKELAEEDPKGIKISYEWIKWSLMS